jgi:hypothetical protein
VSEIFPMETRAMAISFFYAVGTAIGGITGPLLFGRLIEAGGETNVMYGYLLGAALMIAAGVVEVFLGVEAAQKQLEDIAKPLTAEDAEVGEGDLEVEKMGGEDAAPVESEKSGRFERERPVEKTGGGSWPRAGRRSSPAPRATSSRTTSTSRARSTCSSARCRTRASCAGAIWGGSSDASTGAPAASAGHCAQPSGRGG